MLARASDPIVAIATASGRGAVGIVRVSGRDLGPLIAALCGRALKPREATYLPFVDASGEAIDRGLEVDLDSGLEIERMLFSALFATKDRAIGMRHFVDKGRGPAPFEGA